MKKITLLLAIFGTFQLVNAQSDTEKLSYLIGLDIAQNIKKSNIEIDVNSLAKAFNDFKAGTPTIPLDSVAPNIQKFMQKKVELMKVENLTKGKEFLTKNKLNKNVKTTASGLQYEVIQKGNSKDKIAPKSTDFVKVKYEGKLIDGTVFDSTSKNNNGNAMEIPLSNVIKGWQEGISLMTIGSKYKFYIPSELAYGENGAGGAIPPNSVIIFDVELVSFSATATEKAPEQHGPNDGHNH